MTFTKPWIALPGDEEQDTRVPVLDVFLAASDGQLVRQVFVVDSGADISLGPRTLCAMLGLDWEKGTPTEIMGISPKPECVVHATIHTVEIRIREAACQLSIPFCFAQGDAPLLLGREAFFDAFGIHFDKRKLLTTFEPFDQVTS